jgi:hypothetical protein
MAPAHRAHGYVCAHLGVGDWSHALWCISVLAYGCGGIGVMARVQGVRWRTGIGVHIGWCGQHMGISVGHQLARWQCV